MEITQIMTPETAAAVREELRGVAAMDADPAADSDEGRFAR